MRVLASRTCARLNPVRSALYSASLLVVWNYNLTAFFRISPSGDMKTTPVPPTFLVADPFVWVVHVFFWGSYFSWEWVNSTMKSVRTWALIATQGEYSMSNWPSSIAHWTRRPATSILFIFLSYSLVCHDDDRMCLKVVAQFFGSDY